MKKVLIIAYRFPPNNETGAFRPYSWAKYFKSLGYYPTVVTRHWDVDNSGVSQMIAPSKTQTITHEVNDNYEVYFLPFKGNLRTKIHYSNLLFKKFLYRVIYFIEQLLEYSGFYKFSLFFPFYKFTLDHLNNNTYNKVIITGGPFELFHLGHIIKKSFHIDWIADYRDPWTNRVNYLYKLKFPYSIIWKLEKKAELKWLSNVFAITSTSDYLTNRIAKYVNSQSRATIYNGFLDEDYEFISSLETNNDPNSFSILYNGNLFDFQPIERFLAGFKQAVDNKPRIRLKIIFAGISYMPNAADRIRQILAGYEDFYVLTERMPKRDYLKIQKNCDSMLLINSDNENGIVASKVFDYLLTPKPIIILPNDKGPIEFITNVSGQGFCVDDDTQSKNLILELVNKKYNNVDICPTYRKEEILQFSRRNQTKMLVNLMENRDMPNKIKLF